MERAYPYLANDIFSLLLIHIYTVYTVLNETLYKNVAQRSNSSDEVPNTMYSGKTNMSPLVLQYLNRE